MRRIALGLGLLLNVVAVLPTASASAATGLRTGAMVTTSRGAMVEMEVTIVSAGRFRVKQISYTVHGPVGSTVTAEARASGSLYATSLTYAADQPVGRYEVDTVVTLASGAASVIVTDDVGGVHCAVPAQTKTGVPGRTIAITFTCSS